MGGTTSYHIATVDTLASELKEGFSAVRNADRNGFRIEFKIEPKTKDLTSEIAGKLVAKLTYLASIGEFDQDIFTRAAEEAAKRIMEKGL